MSEQYEPVIGSENGQENGITWSVAEIPTDDPEVKRSEGYIKAKSIIEKGIADSIAANLPIYKVKIWQEATHLHRAGEVERSLGEFLAMGLGKFVSGDEYRALVEEYAPINDAYSEEHSEEIPQTDEVQPVTEPVAKKIGSAAIRTRKTEPYISGQKSYVDFKSAAAGDSLDD